MQKPFEEILKWTEFKTLQTFKILKFVKLHMIHTI